MGTKKTSRVSSKRKVNSKKGSRKLPRSRKVNVTIQTTVRLSRPRKKAISKKKPAKKRTSSTRKMPLKRKTVSPKKKIMRRTTCSRKKTRYTPKSSKPESTPRRKSTVQSIQPSAQLVQARLISVPNPNERIYAIGDIPISVKHESTEGDQILYTVQTGTGSNADTKIEPISVVVDTAADTITTRDESIQVTSIKPSSDSLLITTKPRQKYGRFFTMTSIIVVLLLALLGKEEAECPVLEDIDVERQPQPLHHILPALNTLGVSGPLTFAGVQVVQTIQNHVTNQLKQEAMKGVKAASEAFRFGEIVGSQSQKDMIEAASIKNARLGEQLDTLRGTYRTTAKSLERTLRDINNATAKISTLEKQIGEQRLSHQEAQSRNTRLQNENEVLNRANAELQKTINAITDQLTDALKIKNELHMQLVSKESEVLDNKRTREELKTAKDFIDNIQQKLDNELAKHEILKVQYEANIEEKVKQTETKLKEEFGNVMAEKTNNMEERLNMALRHRDKIINWSLPRLQVQRKGNKYVVAYNVENVKLVSPVLEPVLEQMVQQLEYELNSDLFQVSKQPRPLIDISVSENIYYRKNWFDRLGELLLGSSQNQGKRYSLMLVGESVRETSDKTSAESKYEYVPVELSTLPIVSDMQNVISRLMEEAAMVRTVTYTTTVTEKFSPPTTEKEPSREPRTDLIVLPGKSLISFHSGLDPLYDGKLHDQIIDNESSQIERKESQVDHDTIIESTTESPAGDVVETVTRVKQIDTPVLVDVNKDNMCLIQSTYHMFIIPSDPDKPVANISFPIPPVKQNISSVEQISNTKVYHGEDANDNKMVQIQGSQSIQCMGETFPALVLKKTYCIDEDLAKLQKLLDEKKKPLHLRRIPDDIDPRTKAYLTDESPTPFDTAQQQWVFGRLGRFAIDQYFSNPVASLTEKIRTDPLFSKENLVRMMESNDINDIEDKDKQNVGFFGTIRRAVVDIPERQAWQIAVQKRTKTADFDDELYEVKQKRVKEISDVDNTKVAIDNNQHTYQLWHLERPDRPDSAFIKDDKDV